MTDPNALLIEFLHSRAKALRKAQNIPLFQAQTIVALEHGHPNWPALKAFLAKGQLLLNGPLRDLSGLPDRASVVQLLDTTFDNAVGERRIGRSEDHRFYAGPLSDAFDMDVAEWLRDQYPEIAELMPNLVEDLAKRLEMAGPWIDMDTFDQLMGE